MSHFSCQDIYNINGLKRFLAWHDLKPNRDKGQHFLVNEAVLKKIAGAVGAGEIAVEVGAGTGSLTCAIKGKFEKVLAVELDEQLRLPFKDLNPEESVRFVSGNFLNLDFTELGLKKTGSARLVGNIPYGITGKILEKAVSERGYLSESVFTMQKEVADRVLAEPGTNECGAITYYIRAYAEVDHVIDIPPEAFHPPPRVTSSTVKLKYSPEKNFESGEEVFLRLIRGLFNYRRKTIRKGLIVSPKFPLSRAEVDDLLERAGLDARRRPEELTLEDFDRLASALAKFEKSGS